MAGIGLAQSARRCFAGRVLLALSVWMVLWLAGPVSARARTLSMSSGPLTVVVRLDPWQLRFVQGGRTALSELTDTGATPEGSLGFGANPVPSWGGSTVTPAGSAWWHATRVLSATVHRSSLVLRVATNDPLGRQLLVRVAAAGSGVIAVHSTFAPRAGPRSAGVREMADGFSSAAGEHFSGFGGRVNTADQAGGTVETWSGEGAWLPGDWAVASAVIEPWTFSKREDGAYFPMPWLVSSHGYGFLLDDPQLSVFRLRSDWPDAWSVQADTDRLDYRVFAGSRPLDVVRRFSALVGRQPSPVAPWELGPWWDPFGPDQESLPARFRRQDVPGSEIQTYTHYLPCGAQIGHTAQERATVARVHALGYAVTTYVNPMICFSYQPVFSQTQAASGFIDNPLGQPDPITCVGNRVAELKLDADDLPTQCKHRASVLLV